MRRLRPEWTPVNLEGWFLKNFDPGISRYFRDELGLTEPELALELEIWRRFATTLRPHFFPGFLEAVGAYQQAGGLVAVASHSEAEVIRAHYRAQDTHPRVEPDVVYGWESGEGRRKPSPWPVDDLVRKFGLSRERVLVVDDLKPGVLMAQAARVAVAAAGWAHRLEPIERYMRENCVAYLESVPVFQEFVLEQAGG